MTNKNSLLKLNNSFYSFARNLKGKGKNFLTSRINNYAGPIDVTPPFPELPINDPKNISMAIDRLTDKLELDYRTFEIEAKVQSAINKELRAIILAPNFLPWTYPATEHIRYDKLIVIRWNIRKVQEKDVISLYCELMSEPA